MPHSPLPQTLHYPLHPLPPPPPHTCVLRVRAGLLTFRARAATVLQVCVCGAHSRRQCERCAPGVWEGCEEEDGRTLWVGEPGIAFVEGDLGSLWEMCGLKKGKVYAAS